MANFQKSPADPNARFSDSADKIILMLGEKAKIDLYGGGPGGNELEVDLNEPSIASVSPSPLKRNGWLLTYELTALKTGEAKLEGRVFENCPTPEYRRAQWATKPVWATLQVSVMGSDYMQSGGDWGQTKYGSSKPQWKNLPTTTTMAEAGCGPTSLAIVLDYIFRLSGKSGVTPSETMKYAADHGRVFVADDAGVLQPQGTSGPEMIGHIGEMWPGYAGEEVLGVDAAETWLKAGQPLIFLANGSVSTWKLPKSEANTKKWSGGHYMVIIGVEDGPADNNQVFWIIDPSLARTKYTSRGDLKAARIWRVYAVPPKS